MKKKLTGILLTLVMIATIVPASTITAAAATSVPFPSLSENAYCEFVAAKRICVYKDSSCKTRGTCSPAQAFNALINTNDTCRILKITGTHIKIQYTAASKLRTGYIKRSELIGVSAPVDKKKASDKVTTHKKAANCKLGSAEKGCVVYKLGKTGNYTQIIYKAASGKRAYRLGYVLTSDFNSKIKGHAHNYGAWKVTKAAKCTTAGSKQRKCSCGSLDKKTIKAKGHSYGSWKVTKAAKCTTAGSKQRKCSCGAAKSQTIKATGHCWGAWKITKACTSSSPGTKVHTCSKCSKQESCSYCPKHSTGCNCHSGCH
ncbi:MAG: hypothetical protein FWG03_03430 [Clostridiales bacterium]|nr:hypothetical protein [Clostridiales bacterium]